MRFGIFVLGGQFPCQSHGDALRRTLQAVDAAEAAGFDDAWIAEHHFMAYGTCPSATTWAGFALGRTRRITVGTAVSVLSTNHPVALAEQTALLDQLSGGRFHLGVGRGGPWIDLEVFGTGVPAWEHGFPQRLDDLLQALAGTRDDLRIVPEPATRPRPPVTVACTSPATVRVAAERGLPMLLGMHVGDDAKAKMVAQYEEAGGPPDAAHVSVVLAQVDRSRDGARRRLLESLPAWLDAGIRSHVPIVDRPEPTHDGGSYAELLCRLHPLGSPDECVERLAAGVENTGIRHVVMLVEGSGDTEATVENVHRLGAEVLPRLRTTPD